MKKDFITILKQTIEAANLLDVPLDKYLSSLEAILGKPFVEKSLKILEAAKKIDVPLEDYLKSIRRFAVLDEPEEPKYDLSPLLLKREVTGCDVAMCKVKSIPKKHSFMKEFPTEDVKDEEEVKVEIVFSFDTTASMSPIIKSVRDNLNETIDRLFKEVKGLRIGLISHGDYCDFKEYEEDKYCIWKINPTNNVEQLKQFIKDVPNTGGGDADECYELVLKVVNDIPFRSQLKVLVLIGDSNPHELNYVIPKYNFYKSLSSSIDDDNTSDSYFETNKKCNISWKEQAERCKSQNIVIFGCHALADMNKHAISFYDTIVEITGGYYFTLENLQEFQHYMNVIVLKVADTSDTIESLKEKREQLRKEMDKVEMRKREIETKEVKTKEDLEELHEIRAVSSNLTSAFCDLASFDDTSSTSLFRSPVVKREFNTRNTSGLTRTASYATEILNRNISSSATKFINTLNNENVE